MDTAHTADSSDAHPVVLHRGVSKSITTLTVVNGGKEEGRKAGLFYDCEVATIHCSQRGAGVT